MTPQPLLWPSPPSPRNGLEATEKPCDFMTSERYNARESEPRWQRQWDQQAIFTSKNDDPRPKYYVLEMFPYPSGRIHIGHVRNYTLGDVLARFMRAKGFNVLHPMGWDAFGLPAENAAIERKIAPKAWTYDNIAAMKKQLQSIGLSLDWAREFATCDPSYYKHQQKMFLDFLRAGLAEREKRKINWDPVDMTVLANEQVIDGRGWRSGAVVEQRAMTAAGVDAALVHHYFGTKDDLFLAALQAPIDPRQVLLPVAEGGIDGAGERLLRTFLGVWDDEATRLPLLALVRRVFDPEGRQLVRDGFMQMVLAPIGKGLGIDQPELRMSLVASQLMGIVLVRYVVGVEPLAAASHDELVAAYAPVLQRYLEMPLT